jgi:hypothetical protein
MKIKPKGLKPSDRARRWAKKWADYNHPSRADDPTATEYGKFAQSSMWLGFFTGGCKGWYHGYMAAMRDARKDFIVLTKADSEKFADAINSPPKPNKRLVKAMRKYRG